VIPAVLEGLLSARLESCVVAAGGLKTAWLSHPWVAAAWREVVPAKLEGSLCQA